MCCATAPRSSGELAHGFGSIVDVVGYLSSLAEHIIRTSRVGTFVAVSQNGLTLCKGLPVSFPQNFGMKSPCNLLRWHWMTD